MVLEHLGAVEELPCLWAPGHYITLWFVEETTKYRAISYLDGGEEDTLLALSVHRCWRQQLQGLGGQEQRQPHQSWGGDQQGRGGRGEDEQRTWS